MKRLKEKSNSATVKNIRMNCQYGYRMDEELVFLKELEFH